MNQVSDKTPDGGSDGSASLTVLWTQVQPAVTAYVSSIVRDRHHVEDIVQEVAATVSAKIDEYDPNQPFVRWAMGISRYKVLQYRRKRQRDRLVFNEKIIDTLSTVHEQIDGASSDYRWALDRCLAKLPDRARKLIQLRYVRGLAVVRIAADLGKSSGAISTLLYRIRLSLADCVEKALGAEKGKGMQ